MLYLLVACNVMIFVSGQVHKYIIIMSELVMVIGLTTKMHMNVSFIYYVQTTYGQ